MTDDDRHDDLVHIRVMNEYGGGLPLWPEDIDVEVDDLLAERVLTADLMTFGERWDAAIDPEVTDDRWTGVPVMQALVRQVRTGPSAAPGTGESGGG